MPLNLHPEVQDSELASYGGWQEEAVLQAEQPAQAKASGPLPLLDDEDHVSPKQIQQDRPWWMRPTPRMLVAGGAVMALLYVLFSLFGLWGASTQESPTTLTTVDPAAIDQEVETRLQQLQTENENLKRDRILGEPLPQSSAQPQSAKPGVVQPVRSVATPPRPRVVSAPPPRPTYVTRSVATPPLPRIIYRPVSSASPAPRTSTPVAPRPGASKAAGATPKPSASVKTEPVLNPMERWLAAANRGHYIAAAETTNYGSVTQPAAYTPPTQSDPYPPASTDSATPPISSQSASAAVPTYEPLEPQQGQGTDSLQAQNPFAYPVESLPSDPNRLLDIGSSAEAVLESAIAWTPDGPEQNTKHLLRLESGFKNRLGVEVLPEGTTLIAQMTEKADSGLFFMEVTHVLGPNGEKTPVPSGAVQVLAEDGSPLQADLKNKGGRRFQAEAATILAPGIERAMESVADSADSLILDDGDRSLIRTSGDSSTPLASGISGIANGISRVFSNRLDRSPANASVPYFKFDGGQTVRVLVNEDIQL